MNDDLDQLMAVMEASFDPHYREAWTRKQVADSLSLPSTYMILAGPDGEPPEPDTCAGGFVLARQALDEIELLLIAVHPDHRGKGAGRKLLRRFFQSASDRGAISVFLEMRANNPAEHLYRSEGFEQIGHRRDYYRTQMGSTIDAITFAKRLPRAQKP